MRKAASSGKQALAKSEDGAADVGTFDHLVGVEIIEEGGKGGGGIDM